VCVCVCVCVVSEPHSGFLESLAVGRGICQQNQADLVLLLLLQDLTWAQYCKWSHLKVHRFGTGRDVQVRKNMRNRFFVCVCVCVYMSHMLYSGCVD